MFIYACLTKGENLPDSIKVWKRQNSGGVSSLQKGLYDGNHCTLHLNII